MFSRFSRAASKLALIAFASLGQSGVGLAQMQPAATTAPASAVPVQRAAIAGVVVDASTGLALRGARVTIVGAESNVTTDVHGAFRFPAILPGTYQLRVERTGYQPAISDAIALAGGQEVTATMSLQSVPTQSPLRTIASTSAAQSLQKSSVVYRTLSAETLQEQGVDRAGDALRLLPGVNNGITGDTAALGDDINLSIRGIGTLETTASLDGHPIAYGFPGGYDYNLSPVMPLRNIQVTYGSGRSDLLGVDAIGGVVDFQTLEPQVAGGGGGEAARMSDLDIQRHIEDLVAEEHRLLAALETKSLAGQEQERLEEVQIQLDRYYDLLRQRRAREEFGEDPADAALRPAETVERYLQ